MREQNDKTAALPPEVQAYVAFLEGQMTLLQNHRGRSRIIGVDPDSSSGALEWLIVGTSFAVALMFFALARSERRKAAILPAYTNSV